MRSRWRTSWETIPPFNIILHGEFHLDILTRLGEAFQFKDLEAERLDLDGLQVSVASPRTLYRMQRDTARPKDWGDAEALRRRFRLEGD